MLANLYERLCQRFDDWLLAHPKRPWMWWRLDTSKWGPYTSYGRKVHDRTGKLIEGPCMRRYLNGQWEYRRLTPDETENDAWWYGVR
jgi:hypothetical protein